MSQAQVSSCTWDRLTPTRRPALGVQVESVDHPVDVAYAGAFADDHLLGDILAELGWSAGAVVLLSLPAPLAVLLAVVVVGAHLWARFAAASALPSTPAALVSAPGTTCTGLPFTTSPACTPALR